MASIVIAPKLISWLLMTTQPKFAVWTDTGHTFSVPSLFSILVTNTELTNKCFECCRVAYSKMAEEICDLLLSDLSLDPSRESQLKCFETAFDAPLPEDVRSTHLQDAVSLFSLYLSETSQISA